MANEEIKRQFKLRDRVFRAISKDKNIRIAAIKNTKTAQEAQRKHNLDFVSATLLARTLSGAVLTSSFLKGEERIIIQFQGDGPISEIYAEAMNIGEARGYVNLREEIDTENISSLRDAVGVGLLTLSKILYDTNEPVTGIVPIVKGDISTDLVNYFTQSEQIPTAMILDVSLTDNGLIEHSGGIIVQALPGADEEVLKKLEEALLNNQNLCDRFREDKMPDEILIDILPIEFDIISTSQTDFFCRCSKDHFKSKLLTLGVANLKDMREKNQNEIVCRFCNSHYIIDDIDFEELILTSQASIN
jgi:molecular chaperone Hsp33